MDFATPKLKEWNLSNSIDKTWLSDCLEWLRSENESTVSHFVNQILFSDLKDFSNGYDEVKDLLRKSTEATAGTPFTMQNPAGFLFQIEDIQEIGMGCQAILDTIEESASKDSNNTKLPAIQTKILKLTLTDGIHIFQALITSEISPLTLFSPLGIKIFVKKATFMHNYLKLEAGATQILGGAVEEMNTLSPVERVAIKCREKLGVAPKKKAFKAPLNPSATFGANSNNAPPPAARSNAHPTSTTTTNDTHQSLFNQDQPINLRQPLPNQVQSNNLRQSLPDQVQPNPLRQSLPSQIQNNNTHQNQPSRQSLPLQNENIAPTTRTTAPSRRESTTHMDSIYKVFDFNDMIEPDVQVKSEDLSSRPPPLLQPRPKKPKLQAASFAELHESAPGTCLVWAESLVEGKLKIGASSDYSEFQVTVPLRDQTGIVEHFKVDSGIITKYSGVSGLQEVIDAKAKKMDAPLHKSLTSVFRVFNGFKGFFKFSVREDYEVDDLNGKPKLVLIALP